MPRLRSGLVLAAVLCVAGRASAQLTPQEAIALMPRGINLGNTLEPPREGEWNNGPVQEYYFDDFRDAGFDCVRIPVRWDEHTGTAPPYTVDSAWMNRVEQVIDWGLARGLFIIINGHHEEWLKSGYADPSLRARYDSIWGQIAERFKNKSDRLLFEIINEPYGMTREEVDDLNTRILGIIRQTNPTRIVVFSGNEWSGADPMMAAAVPDDDYLMAYYHSYDPWGFGGMGEGSWGSEAQRAELDARYDAVAAWSARNGVPVMISEFGAVREANYNCRMAFYSAYVDGALRHGIAFQVWDDGGDFGIYDRTHRTWSPIKDVLVAWQTDGPDRLQTDQPDNSTVVLSWTNRADTYTAIDVQRPNWLGEFQTVATVAGDVERYEDTHVAMGGTYTYRVVAREDGHVDRMSYSYRHEVVPVERTGFLGTPIPVPGSIEAEDFDLGGEGLTYHDLSPDNVPGAYRPEDAVDIEERNDGGFQVTGLESGEWMEYTMDVLEGGEYEIDAYVSALQSGGLFRFSVGSRRGRVVSVPETGDWQTTVPLTTTMSLTAGEQILRFSVLGSTAFVLDRIDIGLSGATSLEELPDPGSFAVYPNPVRGTLTLELGRMPGAGAQAELVNSLGRVMRRAALTSSTLRMPVDDLPCGLYFVRVREGNGPSFRRPVIIL